MRRTLDLANNAKTVMGSLYGNVVDGPTTEVTRDFVVRRPADFPTIRDAAFVALTDRVMRDKKALALLAELLPEPSPWES